MDGHTTGSPQGAGGQNPAYRPAHRHPPLQLVQLPDITDLLVWAALARIPYLTSRVNAPSLGQVTDLLAYFAEHRATPGSPPETYDEAQRLLRRLGVRS